ncbi:DUF397 domain-containing protein [Nocardiopsis sp. NPDC058631]|uniref:DUF397 domain-containing protein n=1 Tax=Nocardiopsis sp. NPDC058631 TaxID=3346566 RepID=UPI0036572D54
MQYQQSHPDLEFRKSSYSTARGENCVEVADFAGGSAVRDTQNREAGMLAFPGTEWSALLSGVRTGE